MPKTTLTTPWAAAAVLAAIAAAGLSPPAAPGQEATPPDLSGVWQRDFPGMNPLVPDPP